MGHITRVTLLLAISCLFFYSCSEPKTKSIQTDFCTKIQRDTSISLSKSLASVESKMKDSTGVFVLEEGAGSLITRAWLSEYAEHTIDIQYFIFSLDNVGLIASDYIVRAADRGVKVRILVDDLMIDAGLDDIAKLNAHENIELKVYNPGTNLGKNIFGKLKNLVTDYRSFNQRMHNKTFIVDGKISVTGGRNIADEYFDYDHEYNFRDRDVLLLGKVTKDLSVSFEEFWESPISVPTNELTDTHEPIKCGSNSFDALHEYACNPDNFWPQIRSQIDNFHLLIEVMQNSGRLHWIPDVQYVSDIPGKNSGTDGLLGGGATTTALMDLIKNAKSTVVIQSPYLVTTELSQELFRDATKRGVEIKILTNSLASTDNLEAFSGYQRDRKALLNTGVEIYELKPDAVIRKEVMAKDLQEKVDYTPIFGLHAKSMVVDDAIAVIGTFNLDPRSAHLNTECITIINSAAVALPMLKGMEDEMLPENAWKVTMDYNPDSEVSKTKRVKVWARRVVPKNIL